MTLEQLAGRWRRRWLQAAAIASGGATLIGLTLGRAAGWPLAATIGVAAGLATALLWRVGRPRVDARVVARHLNRRWSELDESAELLLAEPRSLSPLERLQRERTARVYDRVAASVVLPHRPWQRGLIFGAVALLVATASLLVPRPPQSPAGSSATAAPLERPLRVGDVTTLIEPPAYTRRATRRGKSWDIEAEAGSVVRWRIAVSPGTTGGALITAGNDTVPLVPDGDETLAARLDVDRSTLYFVTTRDSSGRTLAADFHQLVVMPDAAPTITVVAPEPRTTIAPRAPSAVPLRVLVGDDYGITETHLIATLTTGQGEGVKFREQELPVQTAARPDGRTGQLLQGVLDPRALGLGPGDELYFFITARDNRAPQSQLTRSETYFVTLLDTAQVLTADFTGLAINLVPEYFRSQRQIIIDTERLLAEQQRLTPEEFRNRSENIGLDQHLLRLRYGEIVGDEIVEGEVDAGQRHEHDIEDNATRLAPQVKATLQASLAQMWQAELKLRLSDPRAALPFEYRALELLKEVQQAARVYVRRVGFEPPPLEPDRKRLTGDLTKIGRPEATHDMTARDSLPAIRAALAVVRRLRAGTAPAAGDRTTLEQSGQELAALAVAQPGRYLESLGRLRALIDSLAAGRACASCLGGLEADLLRALPAPAPAEAGTPAGSRVSRTYFDLLRAP